MSSLGMFQSWNFDAFFMQSAWIRCVMCDLGLTHLSVLSKLNFMRAGEICFDLQVESMYCDSISLIVIEGSSSRT